MTGTVRQLPPLLDHGVIGNGRVLALISPSGGAIEWLCLPRFDSPSIFARILDTKQGGTFRILTNDEEPRGQLEYIRNTNVLSTRFEHGECVWELIDFAPRIPEGLSVRVPIEMNRILRPLKGHPILKIDFDPKPDYARAPVELRPATDNIEVHWGGTPLHLATNLPLPYVLNKQEFVLSDPIFFVLTYGDRPENPVLADIQRDLDLTISGWRAWAKVCALPSFATSEVLRSALCLKLHIYHDTGAIIAATTTSIPEAMGTQRTWDYRYCWVRDAAFVVEALRRLGHLNEGEELIRFLRGVAETGPLQPVYGIGGERNLTEVMLSHLAGFGGNGFVRIGNAAYSQRQNDLMGEMILCLETLLTDPRIVHDNFDGFFPLIERLVEEAIEAAPTLDTGIWELRTKLRPHTFSHAMCWVAMHRGAVLARAFGRYNTARRWEALAAREQALILEKGFNQQLKCFTQGLDGENADASNLLLPTLGLIDAKDPRFVSTVKEYERLLVERGLMLRYRHPDDFGATTSAFTICSFWWAEALAATGRIDDAIQLFERLMKYANHLGLFSEDIDPETGRLLGNFPQAYTHVGLIHAATTIGELIDARDSKFRAWT